MKIERVTYQKTFPIGPYLNEKIGVEIQIDGPETPEQALDLAKKIIEDWHRENNPHLDHASAPIETNHYPLITKEVNIQDEKTLITLENATSFEELSLLKPSCTTPQLVNQYMQKMKELTSKIK